MDERRINLYHKDKQYYLLEVLILLLAILTGMMLVYTPRNVFGDSMLPGIHDGDVVVLATRSVKRGDIVVADAHKLIIKRVVAVGGDTVEFVSDGEFVTLLVNGEPDQSPINGNMTLDSFEEGISRYKWVVRLDSPITINEGYCYLLGDNRNISEDSRKIGAVKLDQIEGVVVAIFKEDTLMWNIIKSIYDDGESLHAPSAAEQPQEYVKEQG